MAKSDTLHMRIDPELKQKLREEARRRHVDTSALVSIVMTQWLAKHGGKPIASTDVTDIDIDVRPTPDNASDGDDEG
jgi:antitoxin component of RelBE/YafQ-DinJ toxin-antitoxin module